MIRYFNPRLGGEKKQKRQVIRGERLESPEGTLREKSHYKEKGVIIA
jgi:hypothetical protein